MSERDAIVTDADREAADNMYRALYVHLGAGPVSKVTKDEDEMVQAFARHRIAHSPVDEVARLREALEAIRQAARLRSISGSTIYASIIHEVDETARKALDTRP